MLAKKHLSIILITFLLATSAVSQEWYDTYDFAAKGVVGYWPLDGNTTDVSGIASDGIPNSTLNYTQGALGQAADINGNRISMGNVCQVTNAFTVAVWAWSDVAGGAQTLVRRGGSSNNTDPYFIGYSGDASSPITSGNNNLTPPMLASSQQIPTGEWHHIAQVYDGTTRQLYIDGLEVASDTPTGTLYQGTGDFGVGIDPRSGHASPWLGAVDDLVVFNRALNVAEIEALASDDDSSGIADFWEGVPGVDWVEATASAGWSGRQVAASVVHDGKMWLLGGSSGSTRYADVWSSTDGNSWDLVTANAPWAGRAYHGAASFDGKLWVIGGNTESNFYMSDVWNSEDGANWTLVTSNAAWGGRQTWGGVLVFGGRMWVLGGYDSTPARLADVWSSADGVTWESVATSAPWGGRKLFPAVVYDGKMWVIAGNTQSSPSVSDVWYSEDGLNWTQAATSASTPWSNRFSHTAETYDGNMWILGGEDGSNGLNDVWSSVDGVTWDSISVAAPWVGRKYHESLVFQDKLWVFAGSDPPGNYLNDVWFTSGGFSFTDTDADGMDDIWEATHFGPLSTSDGTGDADSDGGSDLLEYKSDTNPNDATDVPPGVDWVEATSNAGWSGRSGHGAITYKDKLWVLGGYDNVNRLNDIWYSQDGTTWTQATASAEWSDRTSFGLVEYKGRLWLMGGYNGATHFNDVWYSDDGIAWTQATDTATWADRNNLSAVVYANKMWVIGGYGNSTYYNDVWYSEDGVNWTAATENANWVSRYDHSATIFDGKIWIFGGYDGTNRRNDIWNSVDGVTWTNVTSAADWTGRQLQNTIVYDGRLYLIAGIDTTQRNDVWQSDDGAIWTQITGEAPWEVRYGQNATVFQDKIWLTGGTPNAEIRFNDVWYTSGGTTFSDTDADGMDDIWEAIYFGPLNTSDGTDDADSDGGSDLLEYESNTDPNDAADVPPGVDWVEATAGAEFTGRRLHTSVFFDDKLWLMGGGHGTRYNDVWSSSDGATWTQVTAAAQWEARSHHASVVFDNKMWVMGGFNASSQNLNDVWYSTDGANWTQATASASWPVRNSFTVVAHEGKMWVIAGRSASNTWLNDVWWSTDGVNWTQAADCPPHSHHASAVFDNKMWILGGTTTGDVYVNDVWYSADGTDWTQATSAAPWSARIGLTSTVYDNALWVISGATESSGSPADVWRSSDGINWLKATDTAPWEGRYNHTSAVLNSKLFLIGGYNASGELGDVWYTQLTDLDGDGMPDAWEAAHSVDDPDADPDSDDLTNLEEYQNDTDPNVADSDDDGSEDGLEVLNNTNPNDASDTPPNYSGLGVVGYWPLDGNARDYSGNDHHGIVYGDASPTTGVFSQSYQFDGSGDYIDSNYAPQLYQGNAHSLSFYAKMPDTAPPTAHMLVGLERTGSTHYHIATAGSTLAWAFSDDSGAGPVPAPVTGPVCDGNWHHFAAVRDIASDSLLIYVDGILADSVTDTTVGSLNVSSPLNLFFGADNHATAGAIGPFAGSLDDIVAFDRTLSPIEVQALASDDNANGTADFWDYAEPGKEWVLAADAPGWSGRSQHASAVFDNKLWVLGGYTGSFANDVWSSADGISWTQATANAGWSDRFYHSCTAFNGKLWVISGQDSGTYFKDVWSSADGVSWTQETASAPWNGRSGHRTVVFNGELWIMGGSASSVHFNDVWHSADGVNWTQATANAPWEGRFEHGAVVFDGAMWVFGGHGLGVRFNDVWRSEDGVNWAQIISSAPWGQRYAFGTAVYEGKLWVMGGSNPSNQPQNDVWTSSDGLNWTEVTASAPWVPRGFGRGLSLNGKLWLLGGTDGNLMDDVWYTAPRVTTLPDTDLDADGMPDAWESTYGVDDPDADPDSDGFSNLEEYQNGTNPNVSDAAAVVASFTTNVSSGCAPLTVQFTDTSTGSPDTWSWDFDGNATEDSTSQNPSHTFTVPGVYTVTLTASKGASSDSATTSISVVEPIVADFTPDTQVGGAAPYSVQFMDASTGNPQQWSWDFGDGGTSTAQDPQHVYTAIGTYSVTLTASKSGCSDVKTVNALVNVGNMPTASFAADVTVGTPGLAVQFTDTSTGAPTSWEWDLDGDGLTDSTSRNPSFTYTSRGSHSVRLTVSNGFGTDIHAETDYIDIGYAPLANFRASSSEGISAPLTGEVPLEINFEDLSANLSIDPPTMWDWDFDGDGTFDNHEKNPTFLYSTPNETYNVTLVARNRFGASEAVTKQAYITTTELKQDTRLSLVTSDSLIRLGDQEGFTVSGKLVVDGTANLKDREITLQFELRGSTAPIEQLVLTQEGGFFERTFYPEDAGLWTTSAKFDGAYGLRETDWTQADRRVLVQERAGYAILITGRINTNSGLEHHRLTIRRVYEAMKGAGFESEDIRVFDPVYSDNIHEPLIKSDIAEAISEWAADKMREAPAPLYIVLVNHGDPEIFHIHHSGTPENNYITPSQLDSWLDALGQNLGDDSAGEAAKEKPVVVVDGSCFSGSFISGLAHDSVTDGLNRIVITSAAANELSTKGPIEDYDANLRPIRDGELFVYRLFEELSGGQNLKKSFEKAADSLVVYTSEDTTNYDTTGTSKAQHAQLDDNGDGIGSHTILPSPDVFDDGYLANLTYLGFGDGSNATNIVIQEVSPPVVLSSEQNAPELYMNLFNPNQEDELTWIQVKSPGFQVNATSQSEQIDLDEYLGSRVYSDPTKVFGHKSWSPDRIYNQQDFVESGTYEVIFFASNGQGDLSAPTRTFVYRQLEGPNEAPNQFNLITPDDGVTVNDTPMFLWELTDDPEGHTFTYVLELEPIDWPNNDGGTSPFPTIRIDGLRKSFYIFPGQGDATNPKDLVDGVTYRWRVHAYDFYGAHRESSSSRMVIVDHLYNDDLESGIATIDLQDEFSEIPIKNASLFAGKIEFMHTGLGTYVVQGLNKNSSVDITVVEASGYSVPYERRIVLAGYIASALFKLCKQPVLDSVSPETLPYLGGSEIVLTGTGFRDGKTQVRIGDYLVDSADLVFESENRLIVRAPSAETVGVDTKVAIPISLENCGSAIEYEAAVSFVEDARLSVEVDTIDLDAESNPQATFQIRNLGQIPLNWTISINGPISVNLESGTTSDTPAIITVSTNDFTTSRVASLQVVNNNDLSDNVTINVNIIDSPPILSAPDSINVKENEEVVINLTYSDPGEDNPILTIEDKPNNATFDAESGEFRWIPSYDSAGSYTVTFIATDVNNASLRVEQQTEIIVANVNRPPVLRAIGNQSANEEDTVSITLIGTDPDGDALEFSVENPPDGSTLNNNIFTWVTDNNDVGTYENIIFRVTESNTTEAYSDSESITISIGEVNHAPDFVPIGDKQAQIGVLLQFTVSATDPDGDGLVYSIDTKPAGATFDADTQTFSWTPGSSDIGSHDVTFRVSDNNSTPLSDIETIRVTVSGPDNRLPVIEEIIDQQVVEGEWLQLTVYATDADEDPLTYSADNLPEGAQFDSDTHVFTWLPQLGAQSVKIKFNVTDGIAVVTEEVQITVMPFSLCTIFDTIETQILLTKINYTVDETADLDNDGLPDAYSLALMKAVACSSTTDALWAATLNAFDINMMLLQQESQYNEISGVAEGLAVLLAISPTMQTELKTVLGDAGVTLTGDFVAVECDGETCMPTEMLGKDLTMSFLEFSSEKQSTYYPYEANGDPDGDGVTNLVEFNNVEARCETITTFTSVALNTQLDGSEGDAACVVKGSGCGASTYKSKTCSWADIIVVFLMGLSIVLVAIRKGLKI